MDSQLSAVPASHYLPGAEPYWALGPGCSLGLYKGTVKAQEERTTNLDVICPLFLCPLCSPCKDVMELAAGSSPVAGFLLVSAARFLPPGPMVLPPLVPSDISLSENPAASSPGHTLRHFSGFQEQLPLCQMAEPRQRHW